MNVWRHESFASLQHPLSRLKLLQQLLGVTQLALGQPCIFPSHSVLIALSRSSLAHDLSNLPFRLFKDSVSSNRLQRRLYAGAGRT